ncbi:MAG TPA: molybdenum cofactor biosynthesis protein MoaE [Methanospirillum sp.]|nr:molybdenum cofactor biosynthesis protein MoaE [Methanospirillum sp.]
MIAITRDTIDIGAVIESARTPQAGGIVTFTGTVRDDGIEALELEVCEEVALRDLERIEAEATKKFSLTSVTVIHRTGRLAITETIVVIVCGAGHRQEAFAGCSWILEEIKAYVPIWKKEITETGEQWQFHGATK